MAVEGLAGLGSIAGEFARGYREARGQKHQEMQQEREQQYAHVDRLFRMADSVQDPGMKDTLFRSATGMMDQLDASAPKIKPQAKAGEKETIGGTIARLFGLHNGPSQQTPKAPVNGPIVDTTPKPLPATPPVSPGSQTFGNISQMFGRELQVSPTAASAPTIQRQPPALPSVPGVDADQGAAATYTGMQASPVQPGQAPAKAYQGLNIPSPVDITQRALKMTSSPTYGFRDPVKQQVAAQQMASQYTKALLDAADQHLREHPEIKTFAEAVGHPEFGREMQEVLDAVGRFENAGQIEKGYVENWKNNRFEDVRRGYRDPARLGLDLQLEDALEKDPDATKPETQNVIRAYKRVQSEKHDAAHPGSDEDEIVKKLRANFATEVGKGIQNGPAARAYKAFTSIAGPFPPPPPAPTQVTTPNADTGRTEHVLYDRSGNIVARIPAPGTPFIQSRYEKEIQPMIPNPVNPAIKEPGPKQKVLSADALIGAHLAHDPSITLDLLQGILRSGAALEPEDKAKLETYLRRQADPNRFQ